MSLTVASNDAATGRVRLAAVIVLVVLSGCTLPGTPGQFDTERELGQVGSYAHDDAFAFDDGEVLTESQLEAVKYRAMARIEVVRGLKFERDVAVDVVSRDEYGEQWATSANASAFDDELWRGAFLVDGETDPNRARDELYGESVAGYYSSDRIVLVTDDTEEIRLDRHTLVHELTHALQDQQFGLTQEGETIDERRAEEGLIEGEANYVPHLYEERCGEEWRCLPDETPSLSPSDEVRSPSADESVEPPDQDHRDRQGHVGLFLSIYAPYAEGPSFVSHLHETEGWEAVDRAHDERPVSTSQLIHPERYPDHRPVAVDVPDRSNDDWKPIAERGRDEPRTETVGEATLFATLWANGVVDGPLTDGGTDLSPFDYTARATDGWVGDAFRVYEDDADRTAHVWKLTWESESDADAFAGAYRTLLENRGGEPTDTAPADGYRIADDEPFAGAYRVQTSGETVTITGAPTVSDLSDVRAATDESPSVQSAPAGAVSVAAPVQAAVAAPNSPTDE